MSFLNGIYKKCKISDFTSLFQCISIARALWRYLNIQPAEQADINPYPAEPGYTPPLQTVYIPKKPTDQDLHCLSLRM